MAFRLLVSGDRACFKRPEFSHDLVSYDVMTPMAARGLLEAVHWTPSIRWEIDAIQVLRPIGTRWMTFDELAGNGPDTAPLPRIIGGRRDRRMACVLTDVAYVVTAHFDLTREAGLDDSAGQHSAMFKRRLRQGRFFRAPYLGHRCLLATIEQCDATGPVPMPAGPTGRVDLGWMLYDMHGAGIEGPRFFRAVMIDGVIDLSDRESLVFAG